jgi:hypothetical protein
MNLRRAIKTLIILFIIGLVFYKFFFYVDISNGCFIKIKPSITEFSNLSMKKALKTLKYGAPQEYLKVCQHVDTINPNYGCGGFQGGCYYHYEGVNPKEIYVSTSYRSLSDAIAVIVHETCHAIQFQQGRPGIESECYAANDKVLKAIVQF